MYLDPNWGLVVDPQPLPDEATHSDEIRANNLIEKPSASTYCNIKSWGPNPKEYSFSSGEVHRLGQHVPERYLDDRSNIKGTRLKMLCRLGCLPLMDRVGRESKPPWPHDLRTCATCNAGKFEDTHHFVMDCPKYEDKRGPMLRRVVTELTRSEGELTAVGFANMHSRNQLAILLGKR